MAKRKLTKADKSDMRKQTLLRRKEWLGDAVLELVAREVMSRDDISRKRATVTVKHMTGNHFLSGVGRELGLEPVNGRGKGYANAVEVKVYEEYELGGLLRAKVFFIENILDRYLKQTAVIDQGIIEYYPE